MIDPHRYFVQIKKIDAEKKYHQRDIYWSFQKTYRKSFAKFSAEQNATFSHKWLKFQNILSNKKCPNKFHWIVPYWSIVLFSKEHFKAILLKHNVLQWTIVISKVIFYIISNFNRIYPFANFQYKNREE